jgi:hypothetical protein
VPMPSPRVDVLADCDVEFALYILKMNACTAVGFAPWLGYTIDRL